MQYQLYKAAGIIIRDRKLLVTRSRGKEWFIAPGGKVEPEETVVQALRRELKEELNLNITQASPFGTYYAPAAGNESQILRMDVFMVQTD